jgi:tRNA (cmo5U34)-methyltransferase
LIVIAWAKPVVSPSSFLFQVSGMTDKDNLFADRRNKIAPFSFDDKVASVFPDMIKRSVPGYRQTLQMIEIITHQYAQPGSRLYDLGCSLGAATLAMQRGISAADCRIIAVDNSPAMINRCREKLASEKGGMPVELRCADILDTDIANASVVVMNFVMQFIVKEKRLALLKKIQQALRPGGVLVLSEKICFDNAEENRRQTELYEAYKRAQGYSQLEISRKRTALENVLVPETLDKHHARIKAAGFSSSQTWFQCFNFASMLAIKT